MSEKELKKLGFKRYDVSKEESGSDAYHYYGYLLVEGFELYTEASDEIENDNWGFYFEGCDEGLFIPHFNDAKSLIEIIEKYHRGMKA